jgi:Tfp pilus assembly PilM family ATPase
MSEKIKDEKREVLTEKKTPTKILQEKLIATRLSTKTKQENPFLSNKDKKDTQKQEPKKDKSKIENKINTDKNHR